VCIYICCNGSLIQLGITVCVCSGIVGFERFFFFTIFLIPCKNPRSFLPHLVRKVVTFTRMNFNAERLQSDDVPADSACLSPFQQLLTTILQDFIYFFLLNQTHAAPVLHSSSSENQLRKVIGYIRSGFVIQPPLFVLCGVCSLFNLCQKTKMGITYSSLHRATE